MSKIITAIDSKVNELFAKTTVTQKFTNSTDNPLELKIYVYKKEGLIFSEFFCQIGYSIKVKSKVIKKEKAEQKYTDSIASGNAAIFVSDDPDNENRIIINMGNIPPKNDVIFISEFIHSLESSGKYEFEIFRNLPIFQGKYDEVFENSELTGKINIKTKDEILNIEKKILMKNLKIIEEKYIGENKNNYSIIYEIDQLPTFSKHNLDYIPSSKIYFDLNTNQPLALIQKSSLDSNEINYLIQYKYKKEINEIENEKICPALFIFLVDQSGSMYNSIKIASAALKLFIQSLPVGSYYQIIGFGSEFVKYDKEPKEYNKENILESISIIEKLDDSLGGTDIYSPLKDIYDSSEIYDKINLPKNIFLLTDGEIDDKEKTLALIEKNNSKFIIYSIGIGNSFDEDLIKNAGIIGKGNYNFCKNLDNLNSVIATEVGRATGSYSRNLKINTNLNDKNLIKNDEIPNVILDNQIINLNYIINNDNNNIENNKINLDIKYTDENEKNIEKNYEIIPQEIEKGEELSKLIINNYILKNKDLTEEEKIKLALKYQIFTKNTSLFAEVSFTEKITEEMKLKIIGDKENNVIKKYEKHEMYCQKRAKKCKKKSRKLGRRHFGDSYRSDNIDYDKKESASDSYSPYNEDIINDNIDCDKKESASDNKIKKEKKENIKFDLDSKDNIMKMINSQDYIEGCWEENEYTKLVKEKYLKEYEILKGLSNKNIDDKTALTILIIYFINKEHSELLNELLMIIKKAKMFIQKITNDSYDNIIKEI